MLKSKSKKNRTGQNEVPDKLPVKDLKDLTGHRSFVFYGRSGTGKTTLAATFPKPILYMDVKDKGTDSISDVSGIKGYEVNEFEDFELAYWWLLENAKAYKTVVIDTVSQLQQMVVVERTARKRKGDTSRAGDWGTLTKGDWGDIAASMKEWLVRYRDLPMNVVYIAQDRNFNFDDDSDTEGMLMPEIGPALSPSIAKVLNAAVSMVGNTFIRERVTTKEVRGKKVERKRMEFCLRVGPSPIYTTKIRKPRAMEAPEIIVDPAYEDIMDVIKGVE